MVSKPISLLIIGFSSLPQTFEFGRSVHPSSKTFMFSKSTLLLVIGSSSLPQTFELGRSIHPSLKTVVFFPNRLHCVIPMYAIDSEVTYRSNSDRGGHGGVVSVPGFCVADRQRTNWIR